MRFKSGDKVRFLNEAIEGTISRMLSNSKVEVTDSHGFSHVSEEKDLVLVELVLDKDQLSSELPVHEKENPREIINAQHASPEMVQSLDLDHTIYAAIRLMNEKSPLTTDVELHLLNNTQLTVCFTVARRHEDLRTGLSSGNLKPRNEQFIGIFSQDELHRFNGFEFQFLFFGKNEFK